MLRRLTFLLISLLIFSSAKAEDHKLWALQQQAKSQELIKAYRQESLSLTQKNVPFRGCRANQESSCQKGKKQTPIKDSNLYIFVSFSIPKETLKALANEAKKYNGLLVIRGLIDNSFLKTAKFLQEVGVGVILDPTLFKQYDIKVVPTFVKTHKSLYQRIAGNISLAYALDKFKEGEE